MSHRSRTHVHGDDTLYRAKIVFNDGKKQPLYYGPYTTVGAARRQGSAVANFYNIGLAEPRAAAETEQCQPVWEPFG